MTHPALRRALLCTLLLAGTGLLADTGLAQDAPVPTPAPPSALRGLWIDAFGPGLKTRAQAQQTVEDAVRLGVNTLFVQAVRRADCLCSKSSYPPATDPDLERNFDPLAVMVKLGHARGLRVIAWVSVTGAFNTAAPNADPRHVFRTHGPDAGAQSWLARRPDGTWQEGRDGWLDLGLPEVQDYVTQGIVSLVKNYAVDGVQLDRIRYPDGDTWGYDPRVLARYRAETGMSGTPAPDDAAWNDWKRQQVTGVVRRVALEVKAVRSSAWITAATITYLEPPRAGDLVSFRRTRTYWDVLQDWPTWMNEGLLDLNVLMNYKRDAVESQGAWFDGWNAFAQSMTARADGGRAQVAVGSAMYLNPPEVTAAQARRAVASGLGWVGYSYRTPTAAVYGEKETGAQGRETVRRLLTAPGAALAAPAPWTDAPPTVRGLIGRVTGTPVPGGRSVEAWQGGQVVARVVTDGNGYYGFATLPAGLVEVRVSGQRWADRVPARGVLRLPDLLLRDAASRPSAPASP